MVSLSYFHLSNGHTLSVIFQQDLFKPEWLAQHSRSPETSRSDTSSRCNPDLSWPGKTAKRALALWPVHDVFNEAAASRYGVPKPSAVLLVNASL
jgi:hypothetical protein